jgi:peroxiredoxin
MGRSRAWVWVVVGVPAAIVGGMLLTYVAGKVIFGVKTSEAPRTRVGETIPAFELKGLDGKIWHNADLEGRVVFISVWATWCPPCRKELPHLEHLWERLKGRSDVVVLAMNVDEEPDKVRPFMIAHDFDFPVVLAHDFVRRQLATVGIPRVWVLDARGVWRFDEIGFRSGGDWEARSLAMIHQAGRSDRAARLEHGRS